MSDVGEIIKGDVDKPFWDGCAKGQFLVHRCSICGRSYWPASCCIHHGAQAMHWVPASGKGEVHTYTVFHHAYRPSWKERVPYVVAVVKLQEGPFYHSRIVECPVERVKTGMAVQVAFETENDGGTIAMDGLRDVFVPKQPDLPVFKPAS